MPAIQRIAGNTARRHWRRASRPSPPGIAVIDAEEERARRGDKLEPMIGRENAGSSTWQSVARGTGDVEVDYLNGEIVLLGREYGIATPVNEALRRACVRLAHEGGPARSIPGGDILREVGGARDKTNAP